MRLFGKRAFAWLALFIAHVLFVGSAVAGNSIIDPESATSASRAPSFAVETLRLAQADRPPSVASDPRLNNPPPPANPPPRQWQEGQPVPTGDGATAYVTYKTPFEYHLTWLTVALGVSFVLMFCFIHWRTPIDHFARHFIILTVVFSALFLIVAGYNEKQTAPVFGLLGTIVGYMFGALSGGTTADRRRTGGEGSGSNPGGDR